MHDVGASTSLGLLRELTAAAAVKRAARRRLADATAEHGLRSTELTGPRQAHRVATDHWVDLLRRAHAAGHPIAEVSRAAGITTASVHYRLHSEPARPLVP